jgi:RecB family exonuclease
MDERCSKDKDVFLCHASEGWHPVQKNNSLILTSTKRLARQLTRQEKPAHSFDDWLNTLWQTLSFQTPHIPRRLTPRQSHFVWQQIISNVLLLNPVATAQTAFQAWRFMQLWQLPLSYCPFPSQDVQTFLTWAEVYQTKLQHNNWMDSITFIPYLIEHLPTLKLPTHITCIGFDDWPPLHQTFLNALAGQGVTVSVEPLPETPPKTLEAYQCSHNTAEYYEAAYWAKALVDSGVKEGIGIVVPDLSRVRSTLEPIFKSVLNPEADFRMGEKVPLRFNISGGTPLAQMPLIESALLSCREPLAPAKAGGRLASSPNNSSPVSSLIHLLHESGWPGSTPLDSMSYQTIEMWHQCLKTLKQDAFLFTSDKAWYSALETICQETLFQVETDTGEPPIQILGMLEAAGLSFQHLWVCGLQEGRWPPRAEPNPFIDLKTQRRLKMPHASYERETEFSEKILHRLVTQSQHVVLSAPETEDGNPTLISPLIHRYVSQLTLKEASLLQGPIDTALQQAALCVFYTDSYGLPHLAAQQGGGAALLKTQSLCPYKAYVQYRLKVEPPEKTLQGLSPAVRGEWLHKALEYRGEGALQAVENAWQTLGLAHLNKGAYFWDIEKKRLESLLHAVTDFEKKRAPFTVHKTELSLTLTLSETTLKGRLDRLDVVEGQYWIVDYKTGSMHPTDWQGDRLKEPQLPLYAVAQQTYPIAGISALEITPQGITWHTLAVNEALKARWRIQLEKLLFEFQTGKADVTPLHPTVCSYCHLKSVCRHFERTV